MSILGRLTKRNITGKPMRSFAIIFALAASAFALLLCIGGRDAPKKQLRKNLLNAYGGAEMQIIDTKRDLNINENDLPKGSKTITFSTLAANAKSTKGEYAVKLTWFDPEKAIDFGFLKSGLAPGDGVIISESFAKKAGLNSGDTIDIARTVVPQGDAGSSAPVTNELTLKVSSISSEKYFRRSPTTIYMSEEKIRKIGGESVSGRVSSYIDIPDDLDVKAVSGALGNIIRNKDGSEEYAVYKFKVKGLCNTLYHYSKSVVVNKKWFRDNISDLVDRLYINLRSPEDLDKVTSEAERLFRGAEIETRSQVIADQEEDSSSIMKVLYSIIGIGCVLALLGAVSNAIIGFEQSRRKYAVLHSVAASRKKLSRLIVLETLISSVTAGALALIMGVLLTSLIETALSSLDMGVEIIFNVPLIAAFIAVLTAAMLLAAIKPISSLKKMNTAAELKYE